MPSADGPSGPRRHPALTLAPADIVGSGLCIGCGTCVATLPSEGSATRPHMEFNRIGLLEPAASRAWMTRRSRQFAELCPFSPSAADEDQIASERFPGVDAHPATGRLHTAYVGHVTEADYRANGSSGGMVSWMLAELFREGLIDGAAHVTPRGGPGAGERFFGYRIARSVEQVREGAKSRYYPIDLAEVVAEIRATPGRYAVVGIPCMIKAVHLLRRQDPVLAERIVFTLGLFCGHMKSARFVESFAWQMGVEIDDVTAVEFRRKDISRPASTYTAQLTMRDGEVKIRDWWNMVDGDWGAGFFQSSACNACDDVMAETADISFGDAWVEPYSSDGRGTNVAVVRSAEVERLVSAAIADGRLTLEPVDADFVHETQAAGLRQRREGLSYRLSWPIGAPKTRKRVGADARIAIRRKLIYRSRHALSGWSHRIFWLARATRRPQIYLRWAGAAQATYQAFAYSRGRLGRVVDRWLPRP